MADNGGAEKGFWQTIPGILTGAAALITAVVSLVALLPRGGSAPSHPTALPPESAATSNADSEQLKQQQAAMEAKLKALQDQLENERRRPKEQPAPEESFGEAPAPKPQSVNISGTWQDTTGATTFIQQNGNIVVLQATYPGYGTVLAGRGTIAGRDVDLVYTTFAGGTGRTHLTISEDGRQLAGNYINPDGAPGFVTLFRAGMP